MEKIKWFFRKLLKAVVWFFLIVFASGIGVASGIASYQKLLQDGKFDGLMAMEQSTVLSVNRNSSLSSKPSTVNDWVVPLSFLDGFSYSPMNNGLFTYGTLGGTFSLVFDSDDTFLEYSHLVNGNVATTRLNLMDDEVSTVCDFYYVKYDGEYMSSSANFPVRISFEMGWDYSQNINFAEGDYLYSISIDYTYFEYPGAINALDGVFECTLLFYNVDTSIVVNRTLSITFCDLNYEFFYIPYFSLNSDFYSSDSAGTYYWEGAELYKEIHSAWDYGYESGFLAGEDVGYENGYAVGKQDGILEGNSKGYENGYDQGYDVGFSNGSSQVEPGELNGSIKSFVFTLFDAPVSTFLNVFDFQFEGFDFLGVVRLILSLAVIAGIVKLVV